MILNLKKIGRKVRNSILFGIPALLFSVGCPVSPSLSASLTGPVTQTSIFGRGTVPKGTAMTQTVNDIPAAIIGSYTTSPIILPGSPDTLTISLKTGGAASVDITFTITPMTGEVTVTGSGPGLAEKPTATLSADGTSVEGPINGSAFSITGTGNPENRSLNYCVTANATFCIDVYLEDLASGPPSTPPAVMASAIPSVFLAAAAAIAALVPVPASAAPIAAADQTDIINNSAREGIVEAIKRMTTHVTTVMIRQIMMIGTLLDAKHQMESERLFGQLQAETHRDFQVSEQICAFGTLARSTADSKFKVDANTLAINSLMQKRELLNGYAISSWGPFADMGSRIAQYKSVYCDPNDDNRDVGSFCASGVNARKNNDIDYVRTVGLPLTLDIDFTDGVRTNAEEDIIALSRNLFDHNVLTSIPDETMWADSGGIYKLQDSRSLSAVRSIARNSFASIVAAKTPGSGLSSAQLKKVMEGIGVPAGDIDALVGANPSYFAQMDIISRKMFQDPEFITNLYVGTANVARTSIALQSIQIMKDRDRLEAALRKEMLLSLILEMKLREAQKNVYNEQVKALGVGRR